MSREFSFWRGGSSCSHGRGGGHQRGLCEPQQRRDCRLSRGGPQFCYALQGGVPRSSRQGVPCRCPTLLPAHVEKAVALYISATWVPFSCLVVSPPRGHGSFVANFAQEVMKG